MWDKFCKEPVVNLVFLSAVGNTVGFIFMWLLLAMLWSGLVPDQFDAEAVHP